MWHIFVDYRSQWASLLQCPQFNKLTCWFAFSLSSLLQLGQVTKKRTFAGNSSRLFLPGANHVVQQTVSKYRCVAAWRSGNGVGRINEVTLHRARLVLGWVTCPGSTPGGGTLQTGRVKTRRILYARVVRVDGVFKLMAGDRRQLIDASLSKAELVGAFRQVERSNAVSSFLMGEILSTAAYHNFPRQWVDEVEIDWVKFYVTPDTKIGHFEDVLHSQSLG